MNAKLEVTSSPWPAARTAQPFPRPFRAGLEEGGRIVRPSYPTVSPMRSKHCLKVLREAEMAAWPEPRSTELPAAAAEPQIAPVPRIPRSPWIPWIETIAMVALFGFTIVGLAHEFALESNGPFMAGLGEIVKSALR